MVSSQVLVVGEVVVDVSLGGDAPDSKPKLRLGGVVHACRALWALDIPYSVAYVAPAYLSQQVEDYLCKHGACDVRQLGTVSGCPNVILVQNRKETMQQGYEHLLRDEFRCIMDEDALRWVGATSAIDVLLFPAKFDLESVLRALARSGVRVHVDWANTDDDFSILAHLGRPLTTLITSTSSSQFAVTYDANPSLLINAALDGPAEAVVLKENRGGARYASKSGVYINAGAQLRPIDHSVGVGDAFDAAFVALLEEYGPRESMAYAAWIAAEYASTTYPDDLKREINRCRKIPPDEIVEIPGLRLPWEERKQHNIYIAGPDFDYLDTSLIEQIARSLSYHNFTPRRPVRENGQARPESSNGERLRLYEADLELLDKCQLVVAVYEHDDPGTLVEVGLAAGMQKPVVLVDPHRRARNPMLLGTARQIVHSLDDLLVAVFRILGKEVPVI